MAESVIKNFPSQAVSDLEKMSPEYGLKVAKAIQAEWFDKDHERRYDNRKNNFHKLRLYARGEQGIQKYKDELSINGDLSYLNLDWKPVPIIPKFVDIVVNGMSQRGFSIRAYSQDPYGVAKRTDYMQSLMKDMKTRKLAEFAKEQFGVDLYDTDKEKLPNSDEELKLHMQLTYKQSVELAEEQALNVLLEGNKYDLIRRRFLYDLTVLGIGAVKTSFNTSEGVVIDYVDPEHLIYSYTDSPYFDDIYYVGEIKEIPLNELAKQFPHLTEEMLEDISKSKYSNSYMYYRKKDIDKNKVQVLYFNYKTYMNETYKVKETSTGGEKIIPRDDTFNPPSDMQGNFGKLQRSIETLYEGVYILGANKLLKWEMSKNMMRPKSDFTKVKMNYAICAPRMYNGKIESLVSRITGFADMIQLTHLKLQQVMSRLVPDGVYLDADGLAEIDLGNGTNYNPQEALNMYFQTGSVIGRSMTQDGDPNAGAMPVREIQTGAGGAKMQSLIQTYNYYLNMIRDVTGLNEARDASTPDRNALVGIQKIAAANSNTATRHILQAGMFLTQETCECLSMRISDVLEYSPTANAFVQALGAHNVATLEEMSELHLYDFGIFLELAPDEEEKQLLENNIQAALAGQVIDLEDAIDIREIKNIKLANQMLKVRRKIKNEREAKKQSLNIKQQAEANAKAQKVAAQEEVKKQKELVKTQIELEQAKADFSIMRLEQEAKVKRDLMAFEFELNTRIKDQESQAAQKLEQTKEQVKAEPKKFESSGNDIVGGGIGLGKFDPR